MPSLRLYSVNVTVFLAIDVPRSWIGVHERKHSMAFFV